MKITHIFLTLSVSALAACTSSSTKTASVDSLSRDSSAVDTSFAAVEIKNDTTETVFNHYSTLKDALVESDSKSAATAGKELTSALSKVKGCEEAADLARTISESSDIKKQRAAFIALNTDLMGVMKNAPVSAGSIYMMYCPMANEGKGAYWFSANKEVKNPYYGAEMLTCGEVKEEITKK